MGPENLNNYELNQKQSPESIIDQDVFRQEVLDVKQDGIITKDELERLSDLNKDGILSIDENQLKEQAEIIDDVELQIEFFLGLVELKAGVNSGLTKIAQNTAKIANENLDTLRKGLDSNNIQISDTAKKSSDNALNALGMDNPKSILNEIDTTNNYFEEEMEEEELIPQEELTNGPPLSQKRNNSQLNEAIDALLMGPKDRTINDDNSDNNNSNSLLDDSDFEDIFGEDTINGSTEDYNDVGGEVKNYQPKKGSLYQDEFYEEINISELDSVALDLAKGVTLQEDILIKDTSFDEIIQQAKKGEITIALRKINNLDEIKKILDVLPLDSYNNIELQEHISPDLHENLELFNLLPHLLLDIQTYKQFQNQDLVNKVFEHGFKNNDLIPFIKNMINAYLYGVEGEGESIVFGTNKEWLEGKIVDKRLKNTIPSSLLDRIIPKYNGEDFENLLFELSPVQSEVLLNSLNQSPKKYKELINTTIDFNNFMKIERLTQDLQYTKDSEQKKIDIQLANKFITTNATSFPKGKEIFNFIKKHLDKSKKNGGLLGQRFYIINVITNLNKDIEFASKLADYLNNDRDSFTLQTLLTINLGTHGYNFFKTLYKDFYKNSLYSENNIENSYITKGTSNDVLRQEIQLGYSIEDLTLTEKLLENSKENLYNQLKEEKFSEGEINEILNGLKIDNNGYIELDYFINNINNLLTTENSKDNKKIAIVLDLLIKESKFVADQIKKSNNSQTIDTELLTSKYVKYIDKNNQVNINNFIDDMILKGDLDSSNYENYSYNQLVILKNEVEKLVLNKANNTEDIKFLNTVLNDIDNRLEVTEITTLEQNKDIVNELITSGKYTTFEDFQNKIQQENTLNKITSLENKGDFLINEEIGNGSKPLLKNIGNGNYVLIYNRKDGSKDPITINSSEAQLLKTPEAQKNYINLYGEIQKLGLPSLWDYRKELITAMGDITVNPFDGGGLEPSELLKFKKYILEISTGTKLKDNTNAQDIDQKLRNWAAGGNELIATQKENILGDDRFLQIMKTSDIIDTETGRMDIPKLKKLHQSL